MRYLGAASLFLVATVASLLSSEREYMLVQHLQTFVGAYCHCLRHGTTLAGLRDGVDLEHASSLCPNCSVWIGLRRQGRTWVWISGDRYAFQRWSPGATPSYPCVIMKHGLWYPEDCSKKNPVVCYKGSSGAVPILLRLLLNCRSQPVHDVDLPDASPQFTKPASISEHPSDVVASPPMLQNPSLAPGNKEPRPMYEDTFTVSTPIARKETTSPLMNGSTSRSWTTVKSKPFSTGVNDRYDSATAGFSRLNPPTIPDLSSPTRSPEHKTTPTELLIFSLPVLTNGGKSERPSSFKVPSNLPLTQDTQATSRNFQSNQLLSSMQWTSQMTVAPMWDQSPTVVWENFTWFEAVAACRARGRLLAGRVMLQKGLKVWLGLHRHGLWGHWVWANGSVVEDPQSWGAGEPNNPIGGNCGAGTGTGEGVMWEDECCGLKLYFVCE